MVFPHARSALAARTLPSPPPFPSPDRAPIPRPHTATHQIKARLGGHGHRDSSRRVYARGIYVYRLAEAIGHTRLDGLLVQSSTLGSISTVCWEVASSRRQPALGYASLRTRWRAWTAAHTGDWPAQPTNTASPVLFINTNGRPASPPRHARAQTCAQV